MRPGRAASTCVLLLIAACLAAAEWPVAMPLTDGADAVFTVDGSLPRGGRLILDWTRERPTRDAWIEMRLVTGDGRFLVSAAPLRLRSGIASGSLAVALIPGAWGGPGAPLSDDALALVATIGLRAAGSADDRITGTIRTTNGASAEPLMMQPALVDAGVWRELRLPVVDGQAGGLAIATGSAEIVDAGGVRWPSFADQPWRTDAAGRWQPAGEPRWVVRLAPGEAPIPPLVLRWWRGDADGPPTWTSPEFSLPTATAGEPPAEPPRQPAPLPWPEIATVEAVRSTSFTAAGGTSLLPLAPLPPAVAPILRWRQDWGGFRGPRLTAWQQAAAWDHWLAQRDARTPLEIDLLPQALFAEQGPFRFGTAPWTGPVWRIPADAWNDDRPWQDWLGQVREVLARSRAAPCLGMWRLGATMPVTPTGDRAAATRLRSVATAIDRLVRDHDRRTLRLLHPGLVDFAKDETRPAGWFDFASGIGGWRPVTALGGRIEHVTADGGWMRLRLPERGADRSAAAMVRIDANLANLDRLDVDVRVDAPPGSSVRLYAICTDERHRWYQCEVADLAPWSRWLTVSIDTGDEAAWTPSGHTMPWSGAVRRRMRAIGFSAWYHGPAEGNAAIGIDSLRRRGWPLGSSTSALHITSMSGSGAAWPGDAPHQAAWTPFGVDFDLNRMPANPYDPDSADVVGEVVGPDGATRTWPAWWDEPMRIDPGQDRGSETVAPAGAGRWRWRFLPTQPGLWRWRITARVKVRQAIETATSDWRAVAVDASPAVGALLPIRRSASDPAWFERVDGSFYYPIGINLRSPGDDRQDRVIADARQQGVPATAFRRSADWERLGTAAYDRWFTTMQANGMDWARVWMSPWWCGLEWTSQYDEFGGLTWYSQAMAARLDRICDLAEQHQIHLQIELQNHGMFSPETRRNGSNGVDTQWEFSPYNVSNGGGCQHPTEFFARDDQWTIHAKRLRYTLARWGWRPGIAAWVLSSEIEFTGAWDQESDDDVSGRSPIMEAWIQRSLDWFTANDPLRRPVSIHFSHPWRASELWRNPGLGFSNSNAYTGFQSDMGGGRLGGTGERNLPLALSVYLNRHFPPWELRRPTLIGEWGGHWSRNGHRQLSSELRTGVWLQTVMPYGGNTGFWWWLWLDATDRWGDYAAVARFMAGEDLRGSNLRPAANATLSQSTARAAGSVGRGMQRWYCWLDGLDQDDTIRSDRDQGTLTIDAEAPRSRWRLQRWNCANGTVAMTVDVVADARGRLRIPLGRLEPDAAFKLDRLDTPVRTPPGSGPDGASGTSGTPAGDPSPAGSMRTDPH